MTPGKAASQACHAILQAFLKTPSDIAAAYHHDGLGTKVILRAPDDVALRRLEIRAAELAVPCAAIIDSGHVMLPHFDGGPILTAIGIGPIARDVADLLTRDLELMS